MPGTKIIATLGPASSSYSVLRKMFAAGLDVVRLNFSHGSIQHEYYKRLVSERYRAQGYEMQEEVQIGGRSAVDLVATKDGRRIAIEIETGNSDTLHNITKCCTAGFDGVVTIGTCGQALKTISKNETGP